jgi:hypothetical protein
LSGVFPIQNGLKQGDALLPLLFNFGVEYAIKRVQANKVGLKLNGFWWESQKDREHRRIRILVVVNIKIDLREMGWSGINWIDLAQERDQ